MNEMLACNAVGTYQTDGTCKCTDPTAVGPACEFSNAKTCSDAGVAQTDGSCVCNDPTSKDPACEFSNAKTCSGAGVVDAAGQCTCTDDPAVGVGPSCEFSNAKTCSDAGVAQADGSCVCTDPAVGVGPSCEYNNAKTCSDAGVAQADGSCVCTDPAVGVGPSCEYNNAKTCSGAGVVDAAGQCTCTDGVGPACEYSNAKTCFGNGIAQADGTCTCSETSTLGSHCQLTNKNNCNDASTVNPDGTCTQPCRLKLGHTGTRCGECDTTTHVLIQDGYVPRVTACADLTDQSTCDEPTDVPLVTCVPKDDIAPCDPGQRSEAGECTPCEANTFADGTRLDGAYDGKYRTTCKPCPRNTITQQDGAATLHECVASCPLGQLSQNSSCVNCDSNTFSDGFDADGVPDENYRTECKACKNGEISEQGSAVCFAKFQTVPGQLFCYGKGTDSQSSTATTNEDEFVFAYSRVGVRDVDQEPWESCQEAQRLALPNATFVKPTQLECSTDTATEKDCASAFAKATKGGMTTAMFCNYPTLIGDTIGYPAQLCRIHNCKGGATGTCWPPDLRGDTLYPFGCIYNKNESTVMYYSKEDAKLYYNGFEYNPLCERYICPLDPAAGFQKPVPLEETDFATEEDTSKVPTCRLSSRGIEEKTKEATDRNNKTFIPIAIALSFICMFIAGCITEDDLKWQWIVFGVGLRTFDMQTDWGFYSISLRDQGFEEFALYENDPAELLTDDELVTMRRTCLAFCIIGTLLTPFDIVGNLARTESSGASEFAMVISVLILCFEDIPQLYLNVKFIGIMGAGDPISVLSLIASIINIAYNIIVLLYDFGRK